MNTVIKNILSITILAGLLSCQKEEARPATTDEVKVNITSPGAGQAYKQGDTVFISGTASTSSQLHGYIARIKNETGTILYETEGHTHGDNITISGKWVNNLDKVAKLTLEVQTIVNHDEDKKTVNVDFNSQP